MNSLISKLSLNKEEFEKYLRLLDDHYYNGESLISDEEYEYIGAEPKGEKVDLPFFLCKLKKIKEEKDIFRWINLHEGPYIVEDKIDGISLLIIYENYKPRLYTRGNGFIGNDLSHIAEYINLPKIQNLAVRGELVMNNENFKKYENEFKNPRNLVSGISHSIQNFNPLLARDMSFFAYRIMDSEDKPSIQREKLLKFGFNIPNPKSYDILTKEILESHLIKQKNERIYEMDGLVIYQDITSDFIDGKTPKNVVAFKMESETAVTTVNNVIWKASKGKLLKPTVCYESVKLMGADLKKATGFNARFIVNNKIGPGAKILITRSGDAVPKILSVLEPSPYGPCLPEPQILYKWNENKVEFELIDDNDEVYLNKLLHFINTIEVKNFGPSRVEALVKSGVKNIEQLLLITPEKLSNIHGIGKKLSANIYLDLHKQLNNASKSKLMDASGFFPGIGEKRFDMIFTVYPDFLEISKNMNYDDLLLHMNQVPGFNKLSKIVAENIHSFIQWLDIIGKTFDETIISKIKDESKSLNGMAFVFSGFRDKLLEENIKSLGGRVTSAISGKTSGLIIKSIADIKTKGEKAQKLGIKIITKADFEKEYL
jgi:DNA ligase (NAD+)